MNVTENMFGSGRDGRGEDGLGSGRSRNVQRLADVLEGQQELFKKMTERDQGLIKRRIMESHHRAAKEAFYEFGRDELSVGRWKDR